LPFNCNLKKFQPVLEFLELGDGAAAASAALEVFPVQTAGDDVIGGPGDEQKRRVRFLEIDDRLLL
jgi:Fic family protein